MDWDTPMDRVLRERAAKARAQEARLQATPEIAKAPKDEPEQVIIMPNPQR